MTLKRSKATFRQNARVVSAHGEIKLRAYKVPGKLFQDRLWDDTMQIVGGVKRLVKTGTLKPNIVIGNGIDKR